MKKVLISGSARFTLFAGLILCYLLSVLPAAADVTLNAGDFSTLNEALTSLPRDAGRVTLLLPAGLTVTQEPELILPEDRGITELVLASAEEGTAAVMNGLIRICANGIPLTVGRDIRMDDVSLYGGACKSQGQSQLNSASVTVEGTVGFVFGGGFAENGALAYVDETSVTVEKGALVYYEVFGGGHASGAGSMAASRKTAVVMDGTSDYVLGGGFAEDGGTAVCEETSVLIGETGDVEVALFAGGSASGEGGSSTVRNTLAQLYGYAHWAFPGDFAFGGGKTQTDGSGRLEILPTGSSVNAYLGSFASDPGSSAYMYTAELMNCGSVELVFDRGQGTDGGTVKTTIPANFPCSLP